MQFLWVEQQHVGEARDADLPSQELLLDVSVSRQRPQGTRSLLLHLHRPDLQPHRPQLNHMEQSYNQTDHS